jgi:hypothetical protein
MTFGISQAGLFMQPRFRQWLQTVGRTVFECENFVNSAFGRFQDLQYELAFQRAFANSAIQRAHLMGRLGMILLVLTYGRWLIIDENGRRSWPVWLKMEVDISSPFFYYQAMAIVLLGIVGFCTGPEVRRLSCAPDARQGCEVLGGEVGFEDAGALRFEDT